MSTPEKLQKIEDGTGALFHRRYSVRFEESKYSHAELMRKLKEDLNQFSPHTIARFRKSKGHPTKLAKGDEFDIALTGPWKAPVRVSKVGDDFFTLATLQGHPEAGEIEFRLRQEGPHEFLFTIESLARSRDALLDLLYDGIPLVRMAQTTMWVLFCESFVRHATDRMAENIGIMTERFDPEVGEWEQD